MLPSPYCHQDSKIQNGQIQVFKVYMCSMPLKAYHIICMTFFKGLRCIKQNLPVPTFALQIQFTFQGNDLCVVHTNDFRHKYFSEVQEHRGMHKDAPRLVQCVQCSVLDVLFTGMQVLCYVESTEVCMYQGVHDGWCIVSQ